MKNYLFLIILLIISIPFLAQEGKIVYVDAELIAEDSKDVQNAREQLEIEYSQKAELVKALENEIKQMRTEYEARKLTYSESAKRDAEEEINRKMTDYKNLVEEAQTSLTKRQGELLEPILEKMKVVALKNGYSAIIDVSTGKVLYFDKKYDVTSSMIKELNK